MKLKNNLKSDNYLRLLIFLILTNFVLTACAARNISLDTIDIQDRNINTLEDDISLEDDRILSEFRDNISHYDRYSGKVVIFFQEYTDSSQSEVKTSSFKATLQKNNSTDIQLNILGIFNMSIARIEYIDGEFKASSKGNDISANILGIINVEEIEDILKFMNTKYLLPDRSYTIYSSSEDMLFYKDRHIIIVNFNNQVIKYLLDGIIVEYLYDLSGTPKEILVSKKDQTVQIKFLDPKGWSLSE